MNHRSFISGRSEQRGRNLEKEASVSCRLISPQDTRPLPFTVQSHPPRDSARQVILFPRTHQGPESQRRQWLIQDPQLVTDKNWI